jgi:hypothetical protein
VIEAKLPPARLSVDEQIKIGFRQADIKVFTE